jgi:hypothetical protein
MGVDRSVARVPLDRRYRASAQAIYDASGRHQLILVEDGQLFRRSGGGLTPVGTGFSTVTW